MKAAFVNETTAHYATEIAQGHKLYETRTRNMLASLVGERIAIVRTGRGTPMVVGYATVTAAEWHDWEWMDSNRDLTLIPPGSKYDSTGRGKWCYRMKAAEPCDPYPLPTTAIRHGRSWCEF